MGKFVQLIQFYFKAVSAHLCERTVRGVAALNSTLQEYRLLGGIHILDAPLFKKRSSLLRQPKYRMYELAVLLQKHSKEPESGTSNYIPSSPKKTLRERFTSIFYHPPFQK